MSTITIEQQAAIAAKLEGMTLPSGLGNEHSACSIAAINLTLTGRLTDDIPDCMSEVIGKWIIVVQDSMPSTMRNSARWKSLLPLAAGTGRAHEQERLALILDWMWGTVLPTLQPLADERGFGAEWQRMTTERTVEAARAATWAAEATLTVDAAWARAATIAARAASSVQRAAAPRAADAAEAARAASVATRAAADSARAEWDEAGVRAVAMATATSWEKFAPCDLLDRLIAVGEKK